MAEHDHILYLRAIENSATYILSNFPSQGEFPISHAATPFLEKNRKRGKKVFPLFANQGYKTWLRRGKSPTFATFASPTTTTIAGEKHSVLKFVSAHL